MENYLRIDKKLDEVIVLLNEHIKDFEHRITALEALNKIKLTIIGILAAIAGYLKLDGS